MEQFQTPGVFVREQDAFGSSIVANQTAVPVFIGFTERANQVNGQDLGYVEGSENVHLPVLVRSMLQYVQAFGGADVTGTVLVASNGLQGADGFTSTIVKGDPASTYQPGLMHPAVASFFANGGGPCYIVSIGGYDDFRVTDTGPVDMAAIIKAIEVAESSTLLVPTDLIRYGHANYYNWGNQLVDHCQDSKRHFCVMDVHMAQQSVTFHEGDIANYRENMTSSALHYAAAYYPYLQSLTPYAYEVQRVMLNNRPLLQYSTEGYSFKASVTNQQNGRVLLQATYVSNDEENTPADLTISSATASDKAGQVEITVEEGAGIAITLYRDAEATTATQYGQATLEAAWANATPHLGYGLTFLSGLSDVDFIAEPDGENFDFEPVTAQFQGTNTWAAAGNTDEPLMITRSAGLPVAVKEVAVTITEGGEGAEVTEMEQDEETGALTIAIGTGIASATQLLTAINNYLNKPDAAAVKANFTFLPNQQWAGGPLTDVTIELSRRLQANGAIIAEVEAYLANNFINMPASPFMAGIYSRTDNNSGVWTAPANVGPTGVRAPLVALTDQQQENLNVDARTGKSINAIRTFTGRGTLVWGARTNAGNSLDWRFLNVRRLFIAIQTDISIALKAYVFRANVHNTWVEIKTALNSYLSGLFNQGAFAGQTPEGSFQVSVGLNETMTDRDVKDGIMRITIKVAPVRPAEFIVLTFTQMLPA